jgi:YjbE family integral membrane protein
LESVARQLFVTQHQSGEEADASPPSQVWLPGPRDRPAVIDTAFDLGAIVVADLVLSGDNALVIGMAAAGLSPGLRSRAILFGMVIAAVLRIGFAVVATHMLFVPGLLLVGGLLLLWVCWRLYREIRAGTDAAAGTALEDAGNPVAGYTGSPRRTLLAALWTIALADVSMSLDNVLAVAAIAEGNTVLLIFGLVMAIVLMACAATLIMRLLTWFPWISWLGLAVLLYVAGGMIVRGAVDEYVGVGPMLGVTAGVHFGHGEHRHREGF